MFGETGTLARDGDVNVITFRRSLDASPERVWEALTTEKGLTSWLAVSAKVDGREGGDIAIEFDDGQAVSGTISRWDPTCQFAHTWVINGAKQWITNGHHADVFVITAKTTPEGGPKGISAFIVERDTPGLIIGPKEDKMGMRGSDTVGLTLWNDGFGGPSPAPEAVCWGMTYRLELRRLDINKNYTYI